MGYLHGNILLFSYFSLLYFGVFVFVNLFTPELARA